MLASLQYLASASDSEAALPALHSLGGAFVPALVARAGGAANPPACTMAAMETLRHLARDDSHNPALFATPGLVPALLAHVDAHAASPAHAVMALKCLMNIAHAVPVKPVMFASSPVTSTCAALVASPATSLDVAVGALEVLRNLANSSQVREAMYATPDLVDAVTRRVVGDPAAPTSFPAMGLFSNFVDSPALAVRMLQEAPPRVLQAALAVVRARGAPPNTLIAALYVPRGMSLADGPDAGTITTIPGVLDALMERGKMVDVHEGLAATTLATILGLTKSGASRERMCEHATLVRDAAELGLRYNDDAASMMSKIAAQNTASLDVAMLTLQIVAALVDSGKFNARIAEIPAVPELLVRRIAEAPVPDVVSLALKALGDLLSPQASRPAVVESLAAQNVLGRAVDVCTQVALDVAERRFGGPTGNGQQRALILMTGLAGAPNPGRAGDPEQLARTITGLLDGVARVVWLLSWCRVSRAVMETRVEVRKVCMMLGSARRATPARGAVDGAMRNLTNNSTGAQLFWDFKDGIIAKMLVERLDAAGDDEDAAESPVGIMHNLTRFLPVEARAKRNLVHALQQVANKPQFERASVRVLAVMAIANVANGDDEGAALVVADGALWDVVLAAARGTAGLAENEPGFDVSEAAQALRGAVLGVRTGSGPDALASLAASSGAADVALRLVRAAVDESSSCDARGACFAAEALRALVEVGAAAAAADKAEVGSLLNRVRACAKRGDDSEAWGRAEAALVALFDY